MKTRLDICWCLNKLEVYWYVLMGTGVFLGLWLVPILPIYERSENCSPALQSQFFGQYYSPKTPFSSLMSLLLGVSVPIIIIRFTKQENKR